MAAGGGATREHRHGRSAVAVVVDRTGIVVAPIGAGVTGDDDLRLVAGLDGAAEPFFRMATISPESVEAQKQPSTAASGTSSANTRPRSSPTPVADLTIRAQPSLNYATGSVASVRRWLASDTETAASTGRSARAIGGRPIRR
jgi:hypothetical protein